MRKKKDTKGNSIKMHFYSTCLNYKSKEKVLSSPKIITKNNKTII